MKKRILFIIWSNSYGGGAERQLSTLMNKIDKDKYDIDMIEYFHTNINEEYLDERINVLRPINDKQKDGKLRRFINNILVFTCPSILRRKYIKNKYDIEVSWNYQIPSFLLTKDKNVKKISWVHGPIDDLENHPYKKYLQKKSFKNTDSIITISELSKKSIEKMFPEFNNKLKLIYNGYELDKIEEKSFSKIENLSKDFKFIYCNRFDENKNPLLLIESAKELLNKTNKFHIYFLGKGKLEDSMKEKIKNYGLENNITILGYKENPYPYIKSSDVVCLTSQNEGFSNLIIEGISLGKPFISTNVGIVIEIQKEDIGIVIDDPISMSNAMYELITNKEKYDTLTSNCKKVSQKFNIKEQLRKFNELVK